MLWDIIRDFFVIHIFGGTTSEDVIYYLRLGYDYSYGDVVYGNDYNVISFNDNNGDIVSLNFCDYLSTIATIISMVAIVLICCALIKKIYNMCAHIIG